MASATFESVRMVRSAIAAERRRSGLDGGMGGRAHRRNERGGRAERAQSGAFLRGVGASVLIASGYAAAVTAMRLLLATW